MARGAGPAGHRDVPFSITVDGPAEAAAPLARHATGGSFLNFLKDPARTHTAYTAADHRRLREVKRAHDPDKSSPSATTSHPGRTNVDRIQSSDGTTIAFDRSGEGPPVVFVPGLFQHRRSSPGRAGRAPRPGSRASRTRCPTTWR